MLNRRGWMGSLLALFGLAVPVRAKLKGPEAWSYPDLNAAMDEKLKPWKDCIRKMEGSILTAYPYKSNDLTVTASLSVTFRHVGVLKETLAGLGIEMMKQFIVNHHGKTRRVVPTSVSMGLYEYKMYWEAVLLREAV